MEPSRQRRAPGLLSSQRGERKAKTGKRKAKTGKRKAKAGEFKLVIEKALKEFKEFKRRSSKNKTILTKRTNLRSAEQFLKPFIVKREVSGPSKKKRYFFSIEKANKVPTKHDLSYTKRQKKDYQSSLVLPVAPEEPVDPEEPVALPDASKKLEQKAAHERGSRNRNSGPRIPTFFKYDGSLSEYVASSIRCFDLNQSVSGPVTVLPFIGMEVGRF